MSKIDDLRNSTYKDIMQKVQSTGKCAIVRPCSWGKTVMITRIAPHYKKVLYLYPSECIKNSLVERFGKQIPNVKFMTYSALIRLSEEEMFNMVYDLVYIDEFHRAGGPKTKIALKKLLTIMPCDLIGASATPERMDGFDVINSFFNGVVVEPYSLHNAIEDGIIKKPYYCFCSYGIKRDVEEALGFLDKSIYADSNSRENDIKTIIESDLVKNTNIHSMDKIIRDVCENHLKNTDYMRFLVFFRSIIDLRTNIDMVSGWFGNAYPEHTIRYLEVDSNNRKNIIELERLSLQKKTIDLIFSCDMLNEGYHIDCLTGIVMCRKTVSSRIYIQQVGRVLSSEENSTSQIVFDVVDNIHRKSLFNDMVKEIGKDKVEKEIIGNKFNKEPYNINCNNNYGFQTYSEDVPWYYNANHIGRDDVVSVGNEASYIDFIYKTVIEPVQKRIQGAADKYRVLGGEITTIKKNDLNYKKLRACAKMFHISMDALALKLGVNYE